MPNKIRLRSNIAPLDRLSFRSRIDHKGFDYELLLDRVTGNNNEPLIILLRRKELGISLEEQELLVQKQIKRVQREYFRKRKGA